MPIFGLPAYSRTARFARWTTGLANSQNLKNIYAVSFGYTSTKKKVANGTSTAILGATATTLAAQTITANITDPDVPRAISVTVGGTASSILDSQVIVTGYNSEGKVITETFQTTASGTGTINGTKAFAKVTSVFIPGQAGTAGTIAVGTQNKLGVYHRLFPNNTTVKVYQSTAIASAPTLQGVPTVVANEATLERNLVTPLTAPDGTTFLYICYSFDQWNTPGLLNDGTYYAGDYMYSTSTSTSTSSTSTSTTTTPATSTSTSSTSTSSTSSSTSSTSSSTSSTSTSTTTTP
jgi:glucan 1,3-beta-glucosidase